jgi:hypothetical protein
MGIQLSEHFVSKGNYNAMQDGPLMISSRAASPRILKEIQFLKSPSNFGTCLQSQPRKKGHKRMNNARENAIR